MCTAIIVAAGKGLRMKRRRAKQFLPLAGRPILASTLAVFDACPRIRRIFLVVPENAFDFCRRHILSDRDSNVPVMLVAGGAQRQDSVYNGLVAMDGARGDQVVLIHDGVRPFVPAVMIDACIDGARRLGACIPAIPLHDTVKKIGDAGSVTGTIDRSGLRLAQTPQAFGYGVVRSAHEQARRDAYQGTDDASLVERLGQPVGIVDGSPFNIKITSPQDLAVADALVTAGLV